MCYIYLFVLNLFNGVKMCCMCFTLPKALASLIKKKTDWPIARQERDRHACVAHGV